MAATFISNTPGGKIIYIDSLEFIDPFLYNELFKFNITDFPVLAFINHAWNNLEILDD